MMTGGTIEEWEAVARDINADRIDTKDAGWLASAEIGLRACAYESKVCGDALERVRGLLGKNKRKKKETDEDGD